MDKRKIRKTLLAGLIAAAFGAPLGAQAATGIKFDFTGSGGPGVAVDRFDFNNIAALAKSSFSGATLSLVWNGATGPRLFGQGELNGAQFLGSAVGVTGTQLQKFTYQFSIPVDATISPSSGGPGTESVGDRVNWKLGSVSGNPDYGAANYFRLYFADPKLVNVPAGTGYGNSEGEAFPGTLILEGKVTINSKGAKFTINDTTLTNLGSTGPNATVQTIQGSGSINLDINVCDPTEVGVNPQCSAPSTVNTNFFRTSVSALSLDMDLGSGIQTPFSGQPAPGKVVNQTPFFGGGATLASKKNNFLCEVAAPGGKNPCDMLYQGQNAPLFFHDTFVPEPGSLALLGAGLGALGLVGIGLRRRST